MDNQHKHIKGYRDLSQEEIDLMNIIKLIGLTIGDLVNELESISSLDQRWVEQGKMDMQTGLMALTRSVAQPTTF